MYSIQYMSQEPNMRNGINKKKKRETRQKEEEKGCMCKECCFPRS